MQDVDGQAGFWLLLTFLSCPHGTPLGDSQFPEDRLHALGLVQRKQISLDREGNATTLK